MARSRSQPFQKAHIPFVESFEGPELPHDELFNTFRDQVVPEMLTYAGAQPKLLDEIRIAENGVHGRDLEFTGVNKSENLTLRTKVFIFENRLYRILAISPTAKKDSEIVRRCLDSFRFEMNSR